MKLSTAFLVLPVVIATAIVAVANREPVTFRLDPFSKTDPALAFSLPLYLLVFLALLSGVLLGGLAVALSRAKRRRTVGPPPVSEEALLPLEPKPRQGDSPAA